MASAPLVAGSNVTGYPGAAESPSALPREVAALLASTDRRSREEAWEAFLGRYSLLLLHTAYALGAGYDRAMDRYLYILDQLHRDDCRRLRRYAGTGRGKFSSWLVVVARRLCLDEHRQAYGRSSRSRAERIRRNDRRVVRRRLTDLVGAPVDVTAIVDPAGSCDPGRALGRAEVRHSLRAAIQGLAPGDVLLLELRFSRDLRAREIAELMGLPSPFQVYRRLDRVLEGLRLELRRVGIEEGEW